MTTTTLTSGVEVCTVEELPRVTMKVGDGRYLTRTVPLGKRCTVEALDSYTQRVHVRTVENWRFAIPAVYVRPTLTALPDPTTLTALPDPTTLTALPDSTTYVADPSTEPETAQPVVMTIEWFVEFTQKEIDAGRNPRISFENLGYCNSTYYRWRRMASEAGLLDTPIRRSNMTNQEFVIWYRLTIASGRKPLEEWTRMGRGVSTYWAKLRKAKSLDQV